MAKDCGLEAEESVNTVQGVDFSVVMVGAGWVFGRLGILF